MNTAPHSAILSEPSDKFLCEARGIKHLFTLPTGQTFKVLEDVQIGVHPNEVVALLGPSGCGKSTILRILAGLIIPTQGEVFVHGKRLQGLNPTVGLVFQSFALYPWLTVLENIEFVVQSQVLSPAERRQKSLQVIAKVGMSGFEEAYPRELSGGMKQRVGIARALAVNPELLMMDEPFSQVDALTAEGLRAEVIDIWTDKERNPSAIVMVSHDIKEVVYMADRIVVLGASPGRVRTIVNNLLPRPRDYRSPEFLRLVDQLHEIITGHELPDQSSAVSPVQIVLATEPIPEALPSEIVGLLEYLDARGGKQDIFQISAETHQEFGHLISVVKAAEMLNFVDTPKRLVALEPEGQKFVRGQDSERKIIWRKNLFGFALFQEVHDELQKDPDHEMTRERLIEIITRRLPQENYDRVCDTLVLWARFGDLFGYDENTEKLFLQR